MKFLGLFLKHIAPFVLINMIIISWISGNYWCASQLERYGSMYGVQATGATATVYHYKVRNGTSYAVKLFNKKRAGVSEEEYVSEVRSEVATASKLRHPRILKVIDLFEERGRWYMVMPYCPTTLFDHSLGNDRLLSPEETECAFQQIVEGVAYLHERGLAHLDLKLSNILLDESGGVKIIDFGQARWFNHSHGEKTVQGMFPSFSLYGIGSTWAYFFHYKVSPFAMYAGV